MSRKKVRLTKDEYFSGIATLVSKRSTCARRNAGCVIVDSNSFIIATGYNGLPTGLSHCIDKPCPGAEYPSGKGYEFCEAVHAEINALIQLTRPNSSLTFYLTTSPCFSCTKAICNTSATRVVLSDTHPTWASDERIENFFRRRRILVDVIKT